jgi:hypothetical protein
VGDYLCRLFREGEYAEGECDGGEISTSPCPLLKERVWHLTKEKLLFCRKCDNEARLSSLSFEERAGGEVLLAGVYVWVITYADYLGKVSTLRGSMTVVR